MTTKKPPKKDIDWKAIELEYRAGIKSSRALAAEYGVSEGAIRKRAKNEEWQRDLNPQIKERAENLVRTATVRNQVRAESGATACVPASIPERMLVEVNAQVQSDIILSHRTDISRARRLAMKLLGELEHQTDELPLYEQLAELLYSPDDKGVDKRNELFNKVINLASRSTTLKTLADSLKSLVALEREAFGLNQESNGEESGIETVLKRIAAVDAGQ